jgi:hypothetical protein
VSPFHHLPDANICVARNDIFGLRNHLILKNMTLELTHLTASSGSVHNHLYCFVHFPFMIDPNLCNDQRGVVDADFSPSKGKLEKGTHELC